MRNGDRTFKHVSLNLECWDREDVPSCDEDCACNMRELDCVPVENSETGVEYLCSMFVQGQSTT